MIPTAHTNCRGRRETVPHLCRHLVLGMALVVASGSAALSACSSKPRGDAGGRIDIYRTSDADRASNMAHAAALWEFSDLVAEALVSDLAQIDSIRKKSTRVVLKMGDLNNRTNTPTADFEAVQHRIRGKLLTSRLIRDHFMIVESAARVDRQPNHAAGEKPGGEGYAPDDTYLLLGNFFESGRGDTQRYYFEFSLIHLASREIVDNWHYDLAQD